MSWRDRQTMALYRSEASAPPSSRADRTIFVLALILIAIGIGMIYSASAVMAQKRFGDSAYFLKLQLVWFAVGPDLGTAAVIGLVTVGLLFVAGARLGHLATIGLLALPVLYLMISRVGYRRQRMLSYLDPWSDPTGSGFQTIQSFLALGGGGAFGVGLGEGRQKLFFLPEPHTDFVLSALGEEMGFLGTAAVVLLLGMFVAKGFMIAMAAHDPFGRYLALGVALFIC